MKKIITTVFAIALSFGSFAQRGCNTNTPGWGESLGTVSFASNQTWRISGNGITQVWSDAVTATACQKNTFKGFSWPDFNADCRSNPNFPGDLFSWCAVVRFQNQLCPSPWRVPTRQDFVDLDIALGGTGGFSPFSRHINQYLDVWGGVVVRGRGDYWSRSSRDAGSAFSLYINLPDRLLPQGWNSKSTGLPLRCVRDN